MYTLIKKGTKNGKAVRELKALLNKHMGSTLDVTNPNFGDSTESVVKQFQSKKGLLADGIVGDMTWTALYNKSTCGCYNNDYINEVISTLSSQVGVKELTGKNDGKEVEAYLKAVGLGKGYAWCQAFIFWGFDMASKKLDMPNPMPKTAGVLDNWNKSKKYQLAKGVRPKEGDVFAMDFGKGQGHTGIVTDVIGDYIHTIEGNTSADPKLPTEDREGQGVFRRRRAISSINKGFLRYT